ncbi:2-polyprenyl-6-methoxyphenol hydroxylase-like FAD-dependent oxidoreductase [Azorhizobium sp. AG788]|uniref:FAD binding domain-containing protein n=1 Tax=Azorhizobium sp. AG788 TaxID=2183897 RepID=UPI00105EE33D|nr:FAD binding domain-containing protein [Azorhizobium sp. AG788]TDT88440.1 2-polyprenyl-6-methoxyphenol hydroxylase-like FAD-dependent oxidoreductase [Azorhizobium sp. AG788]
MSPRILIVGGSMGGLFAAVLLSRAGFDVTVTERSEHGLEGRGAGLVAQREVFDILREVGIEHVARVGVTAHERIYLDRSDRIIQTQRTPQTQLSWDVLFRTFRDLVPDARYRIKARALAVHEDPVGARVQYTDGHEETADLVIGADGIGSIVREAVSGAQSKPSYVGYATWRGLVPETQVPHLAQRQLFERFAFYEAPGSHILGYLVPGADGSTELGRRRYNWVWYRRYTPEELHGILLDIDGTHRPFSLAPGHLRPELAQTLREEAAERLPASFAAAVAAEPRPFIHAIFDYAPAHMVRGRVALMGDAAFVARPHTAMGVAKAAGDAFALREALLRHPDLDRALAAYQAERVPVGQAIVAYGQRLGRGLLLDRA